jgi:hypothetical protein
MEELAPLVGIVCVVAFLVDFDAVGGISGRSVYQLKDEWPSRYYSGS